MGSYFWRKRSSRAAFWSIILGLLGAIAGYLIKNYYGVDLEPIFSGLALSFLGFSLIK
jgi:uncharacterized membrane protein YeaQ/YmgE (transglycosylase-associated protein family)